MVVGGLCGWVVYGYGYGGCGWLLVDGLLLIGD